MGTVYQLPTSADAQIRLLQQAASATIARHPDPQVAKRWAAMAQETMARYPGPPLPTQPVLDLDAIEGLDEQQRYAVESVTQQWLQSYFQDVRNQLMNVHDDLLRLQKRVAECEASDTDRP